MYGLQVPLVMIPRFTSYGGARDWVTTPVDAHAYLSGTLTMWRGVLLGSGSTFTAKLQFAAIASDETSWEDWTAVWTDPGENTAKTWDFPIVNRWMRVKVTLAGASGPEVTCWAAGLLTERTDG